MTDRYPAIAQVRDRLDAMIKDKVRTTDEIVKLKQQLEEAKAILAECIEPGVFGFKPPSALGPDYPAVKELGDRIGYGNLMSIASAAWGKKLREEHNMPSGGEFSCGPCVTTRDQMINKIKKFLGR